MTPREVAIVLAVLGLAGGAFYVKARHDGAAAERPKTEAATDRAVVSGLETEGARTAAALASAAADTRATAESALAAVRAAAFNGKDAHDPLAPDRAARLRAADRGLCDAAPELAGCAPDRDAGRGDPAVQPLHPPGAADAG